MTLDEQLVAAVDEAAKQLETTRSAFTRKALRAALRQLAEERLEDLHRQGYVRHPSSDLEFGVWESEQDWGES